MNDQIQRQLAQRIEAFAADVTNILQRAVADSVSDALGGASARGGRGAVARRGARAGARSSKVSPEALLREVEREGGRRIEQIADSLGVASKPLSRVMKKLVADKKVRFTGQARGTKYFPAKK